MSDKILRAICGSEDQPLCIGDIQLPCYVLEDGRRVLVQGGMIRSLDMSPGSSGGSGGDRLAKFANGKILTPYVPPNLASAITHPIKFKTPKGATAYGYEATALADLCDAVLEARKKGVLQMQQKHIAERCEVLVRGFARVGIIALVDEVTGYQTIRARNELHKILESYIAKELLPWTKRFPDEFYKELFRLRGWEYSPVSVKRPVLVGKLTNIVVYKRLPPGVIEELKDKNPTVNGRRKYKHHQFLTEDIGNPHLEKHLASVTTLMRVSTNWRGFKSLLERAFPITTPNPIIPGMEIFLEDSEEEED